MKNILIKNAGKLWLTGISNLYELD